MCANGVPNDIQYCNTGTVFDGASCSWPHTTNCDASWRTLPVTTTAVPKPGLLIAPNIKSYIYPKIASPHAPANLVTCAMKMEFAFRATNVQLNVVEMKSSSNVPLAPRSPALNHSCVPTVFQMSKGVASRKTLVNAREALLVMPREIVSDAITNPAISVRPFHYYYRSFARSTFMHSRTSI